MNNTVVDVFLWNNFFYASIKHLPYALLVWKYVEKFKALKFYMFYSAKRRYSKSFEKILKRQIIHWITNYKAIIYH